MRVDVESVRVEEVLVKKKVDAQKFRRGKHSPGATGAKIESSQCGLSGAGAADLKL